MDGVQLTLDEENDKNCNNWFEKGHVTSGPMDR